MSIYKNYAIYQSPIGLWKICTEHTENIDRDRDRDRDRGIVLNGAIGRHEHMDVIDTQDIQEYLTEFTLLEKASETQIERYTSLIERGCHKSIKGKIWKLSADIEFETIHKELTIQQENAEINSDNSNSKIINRQTENLLQKTEAGLIDKITFQLDEYFAGIRQEFDIPICPSGTAFQKIVWQELCNIPFGKTACYEEIAIRIGSPKGSRAIGMANNKNPICIFIPCHRVIGKNGSLVGYRGGLSIKKALLALEMADPVKKMVTRIN